MNFYVYPTLNSTDTWTIVVAIATILLALGTFLMAWWTRRLAAASNADEQAQWRPILTASPHGAVAYDEDTGELSLNLINVGRGPAFGINGEIRSGADSIGASTPGLAPSLITPGEGHTIYWKLRAEHRELRGKIQRIEVFYYDVTEYWHKSYITLAWRRPPGRLHDMSVQAAPYIGGMFFTRTDKRLLPVTGSPRAQEEAERSEKRFAKLRCAGGKVGRWLVDHSH